MTSDRETLGILKFAIYLHLEAAVFANADVCRHIHAAIRPK